ncbi:MAG: LCCL domain-containing protein [Acidimicrobiia bacterium]
MNGQRFDYECPAGGEPDSAWGIDVYTDDSSVCTAAVHVGVITVDEGGTVTIEIRPGEDSYEGSTRNGITTFSYGVWAGSFVVDG